MGHHFYTPLDFWVGPWPFKPKRRVRFPYGVPILSACNVNLVDGLVWSQEAVGSNPTTQTNFDPVWCNGNTTDFDSVVLGSSPGTGAKLL